MKLYFKDIDLGDITEHAPDDGEWIVGNIELSENIKKFRDFLESLTDEGEDAEEESNFPEDWWSEKNWSISIESGDRKNIELPAIYFNDNSIYWRWSND